MSRFVASLSEFDLAFIEPRLLVPNTKPIGPVELNFAVLKQKPLSAYVNEWNIGLGVNPTTTLPSTASLDRGNFNATTSSGGLIVPKSQIEGSSTLSIVVRGRWRTLGTRDGMFGNQNTSSGLNLNLSYASSTNLFMYHGSAFAVQWTPIGVGAIQADRWYTFVYTFDGSIATATDRIRLWIDGIEQSWSWSGSPGATVPTAGATPWVFGGGDDLANTEIETALVTQELFTPDNALRLSRDPYLLYRPASDSISVRSREVPSGITGTGAFAAQAAALSATGDITRVGTGAFAAQAAALSASGTITRVGTGAFAAQAAALAGVGSVGAAVTGTAAFAAQAADLAASGIVVRVGTAAFAAQSAALSGVGTVGNVVAGTGAFAAQTATLSGSGLVTRIGTASFTAQPSILTGSGLITRIGSGAFLAQSAQLSGVGGIVTTITGTGAFVAGPAQLFATQSILPAGIGKLRATPLSGFTARSIN